MALRMSTFIGLTATVMIVGLTFTAFALSLIKENDAKKRVLRK